MAPQMAKKEKVDAGPDEAAAAAAADECARLYGMSTEMRFLVEGRLGRRGLWAPFLLVIAAALLIVSEVYIRSDSWIQPPPSSTSPHSSGPSSSVADSFRQWGVLGQFRKTPSFRDEDLVSGGSASGEGGFVSASRVPRHLTAPASLPDAVKAVAERAAALQAENKQLKRTLEAIGNDNRGTIAEVVGLLRHLLMDVAAAHALVPRDEGALPERLNSIRTRIDEQLRKLEKAEEEEDLEEKAGLRMHPGSGQEQSKGLIQEWGVTSEGGAEDGAANLKGQTRGYVSISTAQERVPQVRSSVDPSEAWRRGEELAHSSSSSSSSAGVVAKARSVELMETSPRLEVFAAGNPGGDFVSETTPLATAQELTSARQQLLSSWHDWLQREGLAASAAGAEEREGGRSSSRAKDQEFSSLHPPHLEDCAANAAMMRKWDTRGPDGRMPYWSPLGARTELATRGAMHAASELLAALADKKGKKKSRSWSSVQEAEQLMVEAEALWGVVSSGGARVVEGREGAKGLRPTWPAVFPPWVQGADEDNLFLTRLVQHDLWQLQHPRDCSAPDTRFLVVNASSQQYTQYMGVGAQIAWLTGVLATAVNEGRVMVISYYDRADHDGCQGPARSQWSCYFSPETSEQCQQRALKLAQDPEAVQSGLVSFSQSRAPKPNRFFFYNVPRLWGYPWKAMERTEEVGGGLVGRTYMDPRRWWFAQATRYFLRFPSLRLCHLVNKARNHAFGNRVATQVLTQQMQRVGFQLNHRKQHLGQQDQGQEVLETGGEAREEDDLHTLPLWIGKQDLVGLERLWAISQRPYVPQGLISLHVRQGDKDREMRLFSFSAYMKLAGRVRMRFPHASSVWLSTEMESVVSEATKSYPDWTFHYTEFPRQAERNMSMKEYESGLGMEQISDNAFVNLLISAEADFFVGALGSTWSLLTNNLRITSGKLRSGFLSVNGDRYWFAKRTEKEDLSSNQASPRLWEPA